MASIAHGVHLLRMVGYDRQVSYYNILLVSYEDEDWDCIAICNDVLLIQGGSN